MFHNDIVNILETLNKWNLLKICIQTVTYPTDILQNMQVHKNYVVAMKGFALNHDKICKFMSS